MLRPPRLTELTAKVFGWGSVLRGHWGVEIISAQLRATSIVQGVREVFDKIITAIDAAQEVPTFHIPNNT
ncbi:hypothetical protein [Nocardiopsis sp. JB363]|uniref:hypothetical protein n=1 Tax=Nocardiopsis sp. JB363 TaxID=1434837 RepID=UPI00097A5ECA|nr:hypothetical protein [Nocardiopsis sp. JB363]SIO90815.1 hypothetical protein BQ8420_28585 [Nocardiopsis sp. JB363]